MAIRKRSRSSWGSWILLLRPPVSQPGGPISWGKVNLWKLKEGVRGKYLERARASASIVLLDPDLSKVCPTSESVNEALRTLVAAARSAVPSPRRCRAKPA